MASEGRDDKESRDDKENCPSPDPVLQEATVADRAVISVDDPERK